MKTSLRKILLVEDDPEDVELTLEALKAMNFANEVLVARDGEQALDFLYRRGSYSKLPDGDPLVVLLDLRLPKIDGFEVLNQIKKDEKLKMIPVVVLTSSREEEDILKGYRLGVNAFVMKPINFEEFIKVVGQVGLFWAVINLPPPSQT